MQAWTALLGLLAATALSACNVIDDHAPTFGPSTAASPLKPGMWQTPSNCETAPPFPRGKVCVHPDDGLLGPLGQVVVTARALRPLSADPEGSPGVSYVVSPGSPMLMQIQVDIPEKLVQPGLRSGRHVVFLALEPTARDASGRITAATVWPVLCGPAAQLDSPTFDWNDGQNNVTKHPFVGLTLDGMSCTARDEASIRAAARTSRSIGETLRYEQAGASVRITPAMIDAGVLALRASCPCDVAFPVGGEEDAAEAVLRAALATRPSDPPHT